MGLRRSLPATPPLAHRWRPRPRQGEKACACLCACMWCLGPVNGRAGTVPRSWAALRRAEYVQWTCGRVRERGKGSLHAGVVVRCAHGSPPNPFQPRLGVPKALPPGSAPPQRTRGGRGHGRMIRRARVCVSARGVCVCVCVWGGGVHGGGAAHPWRPRPWPAPAASAARSRPSRGATLTWWAARRRRPRRTRPPCGGHGGGGVWRGRERRGREDKGKGVVWWDAAPPWWAGPCGRCCCGVVGSWDVWWDCKRCCCGVAG